MEILERGNPSIVDAVEEGEPILVGEGWREILEKYRNMKRRGKLKRTRTSITF